MHSALDRLVRHDIFTAETGSGHVSPWTARRKAAAAIWHRARWKLCCLAPAAALRTTSCSFCAKAARMYAAAKFPEIGTRRKRSEGIHQSIHFHFTVRGRNLKPNVVERAIKLSHDKYCSASIMLEKTAE
jgi:putative redox protein